MTDLSTPEAAAPAASLRELAFDRNRAAVLAFEFLWGIAMPFVQCSTVLPGYLRHLGVANAWIGLVPALHNAALALVQPLSAYAIAAGPGRLWRLRMICVVGACSYVGLGLWVLAGVSSPALGLGVALLAALTFAIAIGAGDPLYMSLIVDWVPERLRGRYFGLRANCLGIGGLFGGMLAALVLRSAAAPADFGFSFLAGGLIFAGSQLSIRHCRERPSLPTTARDGFHRHLRDQIFPWVRLQSVRAFLVAVVFFALAAGGFPFLALLLRDRLGETDRLFGLLGSLFMGASLLMSWLLGWVCDRWGARRAFALTLLILAAGFLGCLYFRDRTMLLICYLLASAWFPGQMVAMTNLALKLAADLPAAEVTAAMMATMALPRLLGPVLVGAAIDRWSYTPALLICVGCAGTALLALEAPVPALRSQR